MKVVVVINQGGGTAGRRDEARHALEEAGIEADITTVTDPAGLRAAFEAAARQRPDAIVAGGGDGTVSCAASVAVEQSVALGVLPLGTLNHLARDAGIPFDPRGAAAVIVAGQARPIDVAEVNGEVFVNNSAVGLYPEMLCEREAQRKLGRSRRLAMLIASLRALRHFKRRRLTIRIEGEPQPIATPLLFIGNNDYDIALFALGRRAALDGGELCLYALLAQNRRELFSIVARRFVGRLDQQRDFIRIAGLQSVEIESGYPALSVSVDGERLLAQTPLRYRIRPGALRLLMPERRDHE